MQIYKVGLGVVLLFSLAGCADMKKREIGAIAGTGIGAALGSQIGGSGVANALGAAGGAVLGNIAGQALGKELDSKNKE